MSQYNTGIHVTLAKVTPGLIVLLQPNPSQQHVARRPAQ